MHRLGIEPLPERATSSRQRFKVKWPEDCLLKFNLLEQMFGLSWIGQGPHPVFSKINHLHVSHPALCNHRYRFIEKKTVLDSCTFFAAADRQIPRPQ